jgi:hypothetical protein
MNLLLAHAWLAIIEALPGHKRRRVVLRNPHEACPCAGG